MNNKKQNKTDCIFCKIVTREIASETVFEDEKTLAFLDINPVTPGHTLIVPKIHFSSMIETSDETIAHIFKVSKELMKKIKKVFDADFVALVVVGIDVPHLHIHLIPRKLSEDIPNFWPTKKYQEGEIEKSAEKIRLSF